ncbi:MAG TPA: chemotaxis protein CheB [Verrucomicrobiae bacterium]|nr:chemotaxis protein CheB [Verrucomicrobiae bacterium]
MSQAGVIEEEASKIPFSIVGIGASAGGLEAATALLQSLPANTGMAFVLVQHLSPTHKSMLSDILSKKSAMPVMEAVNGMEVAPNSVYVIPPNVCMSILNGFLHLQQRKSELHEQNLPIDFFLCSLAEYQKDKAMAIILSGTASDGSLGIKVIKGYGGIVFAQDETAKFDQMPQNAIATGAVDFVLSPERMAQELINISRHPYSNTGAKTDELIPEAESLRQIFMLLRKASGVDFTNYKVTTLKRRILRRMMLNRIDSLKSYISYLVDHPKEIQTLSQEVFITVTRFFRDPETFEALGRDVFSSLIKTRSPNEPIRLWTTGCSTGEEAYSLAINLLEFLEKEDKASTPVQIFATDIMAPSIEHARLGIYPENIVNDVSPERLKRFFRKIDKGYQVNKSLREICVFAKHNITADPPFSKIDLISCRNLLIYLDGTVQKRIMPILHYALNPGGFLLLGQSENIVAFPELFSVVNKKAKIYSKKSFLRTPSLMLPARASSQEVPAAASPAVPSGAPSIADIQKEADRVVLKMVHHCGVVINEAMEVVQFRGDTSRYLKHLPGTASLNLFKMLQEGLSAEIRNAIQKATETNASCKTQNIRMSSHSEGSLDVSIKVSPFKVPLKNQRFFLIVFEQPGSAALPKSETQSGPETASPVSDKELAKELESTRLHLQGLLDDKEAAYDELQAANEEVLSTNEELQSLNEEFQSANEELESAKEELQATNEEITTLNDELQSRNLQLTELNDDHINLMNSISLPLVMVGRDLRIRRFTPAAEKVLRLIRNDIGRPLSDIRSDMDLQDLEAMLLEVMRADTVKELELRSQKAQWYKIQIRAYKTSDQKIDGAIVTFTDITRLKTYAYYRETIFQTVRHPLLILNAVLRVKSANKAFYETFQVKPEDTLNCLLFSLGNGQWNIPTLRKFFEELLPKRKVISNYEVQHNFPRIGRRTMLLNACQIEADDNGEDSILLSIDDITESKAQGNLTSGI